MFGLLLLIFLIDTVRFNLILLWVDAKFAYKFAASTEPSLSVSDIHSRVQFTVFPRHEWCTFRSERYPVLLA